jgi:stage II sporulation protein M
MPKERFEGLLGGIYSRNETFIVLSAMMFICSVFIGYAFAGMLEPILANILGDFKRRVVEGDLKLDTLSLFFNNLQIALLVYAGGIIFGLGTAYFLIYNGIFIGYAGSQYQLGDFIIATIPHGVFEIIGIIIAGAAGFRLANIIINILKGALKLQSDFNMVNQFKFLLEVNYDDFKDTLIMMAIAVVLILIAAIIEANFTPGWIQYMNGVA